MTQENEIQALPCPFCGSTSIDVMNGSTFRWRFAYCMACGAQAGEVRAQTLGEGTPEAWEIAAKIRAIEEWNVRAPVESLQAALAAERERGRRQRKVETAGFYANAAKADCWLNGGAWEDCEDG